jgi:C1A family cysteine protease
MDEHGFGWHRDLPDIRDYNERTPSVAKVVQHLQGTRKSTARLPAKVDLRQYCSPIEDQGSLGSCVAQASVGLLEYFQLRAFGKHLDASRLFVYKNARNLLGWRGDTGAYLRTGMQALVTFGAPPEIYWPYKTSVFAFDAEPPSFCYAFASNYKTVEYYRLDPIGRSPADVLTAVKEALAAGLPSMFGFTVYRSIPAVGDGRVDVPFPKSGDRITGGHAVVCVGYDDSRVIDGLKGALLIRNSWGTRWGDQGYGWLPYQYVTAGLAVDWWSLVRAEFLDLAKFY